MRDSDLDLHERIPHYLSALPWSLVLATSAQIHRKVTRNLFQEAQTDLVVNDTDHVQGRWYKYGCRPPLFCITYSGSVCWMCDLLSETTRKSLWMPESGDIVITILSTRSASN